MTTDQAQRPRFYEGQYLGSQDLTAAVDYARMLAARHALGAHTWGIGIGLELREVPKPGGSFKRVDVVLEPGYAWDGFGRVINVLAPYKVPESLFDAIKYDVNIDSAGLGRLIEIWIRYDEVGFCNPSPGFEVCDTPDQSARIQETFRVVIGQRKSHIDRHDPIVVAGKSSDAQKALKLFDPNAPDIYDESIPQQTFPNPGDKAEWLIPIGYVRWQPVQNGPGSFIPHPAEDDPKIRAFRNYIGVVTEAIEAADGAIRLRDRTRDPAKSFYQPPAEELVNVEGHMRVEGDVRLAAGNLDFRVQDGTDMGTPIRFQRTGDKGKLPGQMGGRSLQLVLGPDDQTDNQFNIGPVKKDGTFVPQVTVVSSGQVGVGTTSPDRLVTLAGDSGTYLNIKADKGKEEILIGADSNGGIVSSMTNNDLLLRAGVNDTKVTIKTDGKVGIGTGTPDRLLTLQGSQGTYLNVKGDGGAEEVLLGADAAGGIVSTMTNHDLVLRAGTNSSKVWIKTDGKVGVGTGTPAQQFHVIGDRLRLENNGKYVDLRTDGSQVDLQSETNKLYLRSSGPSGNNQIIMNYDSSTDGEVGIGTENPQAKLHVARNVAGDNTDPTQYVAMIENTATAPGGDVLALKVNDGIPDINNSFITFFSDSGVAGSIEGYPGWWGLGVSFNSYGADYAERLPHLDDQETFQAGDVIGIVEGKVTHRVGGAQAVSVVTDRPIVVANSPRPSDPRKFEKVTFIGQVMVKVNGPVKAGDYIVPSGQDDGIGLAVPAEKLSVEQAGQIVGQAWETVTADGVKRVLTAIGLPVTNAALLRVLGEQIKALQQEVAGIKQ
ncbi:MAG TPA: hypothetical protein VMC09_11535 [Anaerolineales bacterium]|nr:hypothetical protein [Anaerolineales bacterium]